jgi:hypothetical protein
MPSSLKRVVALAALVLATSACQMTVQVTTKLNNHGGGTFGLMMTFDRELRAQLEAADSTGRSGTGLLSVESLFDTLGRKGWTIARQEPDGGLMLSATRSFKDSADFDSVFADLAAARSGGQIGSARLNLGYKTHRSFLKTTSTFTGSFDTTGNGVLNADTQKVLRQLASSVVHFEIRTELPGSISDVRGNGTLSDGQVVWRPELGTAAAFSATASALRVGSLLMIIVPLLLIGGGLAWFLIGRRAPAAAPSDEVEAPRIFVPDPEPVSAPVMPVIEPLPAPIAPVIEPEVTISVEQPVSLPAAIEPPATT